MYSILVCANFSIALLSRFSLYISFCSVLDSLPRPHARHSSFRTLALPPRLFLPFLCGCFTVFSEKAFPGTHISASERPYLFFPVAPTCLRIQRMAAIFCVDPVGESGWLRVRRSNIIRESEVHHSFKDLLFTGQKERLVRALCLCFVGCN